MSMAAENKRPKFTEEFIEKLTAESMETIDLRTKIKPSILFSPSDVILKVEGFKLHVHKQVLVDNSPVFKSLLESDFKEKHQKEIYLPEKRIKDFEKFLLALYHPDFRPITDDNVFILLPLADEYQVSKIKSLCESFLIQRLQQVISCRMEHLDIHTLLNYVSNIEKYNLTAALPHVVYLCARQRFESLSQAAEEVPISKEMLSQICIERTKLMDTLIEHKMEKGDFSTVLETLDVHFGMHDKESGGYIKMYEDQLAKACREKKITKDNLVEFIIAGERYNLKKLLSEAISLASQCSDIDRCTRYSEITKDTKVKILSARVSHMGRGRIDIAL